MSVPLLQGEEIGSEVIPAIERECRRGHIHGYFALVEHDFHQYIPFLVAEEYHLQVGCHRGNLKVAPHTAQALGTHLVGVAVGEAHQCCERDDVAIVSETEIGAMFVRRNAAIGFGNDVAHKIARIAGELPLGSRIRGVAGKEIEVEHLPQRIKFLGGENIEEIKQHLLDDNMVVKKDTDRLTVKN